MLFTLSLEKGFKIYNTYYIYIYIYINILLIKLILYLCACVFVHIYIYIYIYIFRGGTVHVFVPNRHDTDLSVRCIRPCDEYRQFTPNPEGGTSSNAMLFDNRQQKNSECSEFRA